MGEDLRAGVVSVAGGCRQDAADEWLRMEGRGCFIVEWCAHNGWGGRYGAQRLKDIEWRLGHCVAERVTTLHCVAKLRVTFVQIFTVFSLSMRSTRRRCWIVLHCLASRCEAGNLDMPRECYCRNWAALRGFRLQDDWIDRDHSCRSDVSFTAFDSRSNYYNAQQHRNIFRDISALCLLILLLLL
jgi:hypothetical protein